MPSFDFLNDQSPLMPNVSLDMRLGTPQSFKRQLSLAPGPVGSAVTPDLDFRRLLPITEIEKTHFSGRDMLGALPQFFDDDITLSSATGPAAAPFSSSSSHHLVSLRAMDSTASEFKDPWVVKLEGGEDFSRHNVGGSAMSDGTYSPSFSDDESSDSNSDAGVNLRHTRMKSGSDMSLFGRLPEPLSMAQQKPVARQARIPIRIKAAPVVKTEPVVMTEPAIKIEPHQPKKSTKRKKDAGPTDQLPRKKKRVRGKGKKFLTPIVIPEFTGEVNISLKALTDRPSDLYNRANDHVITIGDYTKAQRRAKIEKFKRKLRNQAAGVPRKSHYKCRKNFAVIRPRIGGRFAKLTKEQRAELTAASHQDI